MKTATFNAILAVAFAFTTSYGFGQSEAIQPNFLDVHINQGTSRAELSQFQKEMQAYNIGFRYDLIEWNEGQLQSIRFAVRLPDGTMRRNVYEAMYAETDIWIRLEGSGEERIFCAGSDCGE